MSRVVKQVCLHGVVAFFLSATLFVASSAAQTVKSDIQKMKGWQSCSSCAGAGGTGPVASFSMTQFQTSPSITGASSRQHIKPSKPYSNALWWKQLGANNGVSHFVYDIYFY